jgi:hypothetical protein
MQLCYHGPTSAVHDPLLLGTKGFFNQQHNNPTSKRDIRTMLASNALESRAWEEFALGSAAIQSDIPREAISTLLKLHWAWIGPMFMWVYRPAFMRECFIMIGDRPLISLQVICRQEANIFRNSSSRYYAPIQHAFRTDVLGMCSSHAPGVF